MVKKIAVLVFIGLLATVSVSSGDCTHVDNSHVQYFESCQCYACAGTGPGCTYCYGGGDSCYTDAASCGPFEQQP